jgi:hypothetical protein
MQPISKVIGSSYWSCWSIRSLSQPKGKYYDHMGRTRYVLEEKASDIFDRGLGENWFLCGWAMRATVDAIVTRQQAGHGNRSDKTAKNRTAFQVQNGLDSSVLCHQDVPVTEERLPKADFSHFYPHVIHLYNLQKDPFEDANVALTNQDRVEQMVSRLREKVKNDPDHHFAVQNQFVSQAIPDLFLFLTGVLVSILVVIFLWAIC